MTRHNHDETDHSLDVILLMNAPPPSEGPQDITGTGVGAALGRREATLSDKDKEATHPCASGGHESQQEIDVVLS